jgi:hypothetical protein
MFRDDLQVVLDEIRDMLVEKNRRYGNSALEPVRVFSKADPLEQLKVRMDDKLSRIRSAQADDDEDVINDLLGYLLIYKVAQRGVGRVVSDPPAAVGMTRPKYSTKYVVVANFPGQDPVEYVFYDWDSKLTRDGEEVDWLHLEPGMYTNIGIIKSVTLKVNNE